MREVHSPNGLILITDISLSAQLFQSCNVRVGWYQRTTYLRRPSVDQLFLRSRVYMISAGSADSQQHSNNTPYLQTITEDSASEAELQCALRCVPHTPYRSGAAEILWPRSSATLHRCRGVERQIPAAQCVTGAVVLLGCGYRNKAATVGVFRWLLSVCAVWMACEN